MSCISRCNLLVNETRFQNVKIGDISHYGIVLNAYFSLWVTFASATAKAWTAVKGYWKSKVYALFSILPNCIT